VDNYGILTAKEEAVLDNITAGAVHDFCCNNLHHAGSGRVCALQADILWYGIFNYCSGTYIFRDLQKENSLKVTNAIMQSHVAHFFRLRKMRNAKSTIYYLLSLADRKKYDF
jgi:hypothetical protein